MERFDECSTPGRLARRRVAMAILLTAGTLAAMASFSGVSFATGTHGTPAHHQYGGKHH
jgi:hypothetical protein